MSFVVMVLLALAPPSIAWLSWEAFPRLALLCAFMTALEVIFGIGLGIAIAIEDWD